MKEKGERRKEKGERREEKGERRKERGNGREDFLRLGRMYFEVEWIGCDFAHGAQRHSAKAGLEHHS
ncbi:MAG TPA: hypothetical protein PLM27_06230 [Chitinophagales bacterium]|nr:hypothetical protein [Chitinophagales bacterium]